jgi:hypothetical protein
VVARLTVALSFVAWQLAACAGTVKCLDQITWPTTSMGSISTHMAASVACLLFAGIVSRAFVDAVLTNLLAVVVGSAGVLLVDADLLAGQHAAATGGRAELKGLLNAAEMDVERVAKVSCLSAVSEVDGCVGEPVCGALLAALQYGRNNRDCYSMQQPVSSQILLLAVVLAAVERQYAVLFLFVTFEFLYMSTSGRTLQT